MDLDDDGDQDILSGSYSRHDPNMAGLFQILWRQSDGTFEKPTPLTGTDGEPLIIPIESKQEQIQNICTRPTAVDWDSDGDLDLVVGNFAGTFYLFTGKGRGVFLPEPKQLMSGDKPLKIDGYHSDPFPVDWDQDGDLDLVSGSSRGGVQWSENVAGADEAPELKPFQPLIEPAKEIARGTQRTRKEDELSEAGIDTRVWVEDINSDGLLDLLVGDKVSIAGSEGKPERTGFVWLYLQKKE